MTTRRRSIASLLVVGFTLVLAGAGSRRGADRSRYTVLPRGGAVAAAPGKPRRRRTHTDDFGEA